MKNILNRFGIMNVQLEDPVLSQSSSQYVIEGDGDIESIRAHRDFLKAIDENESKRLDTLEAKTSQMISQTAIIFSLLSLFVPLLADKVESLSLASRIIFTCLLTFSFLFYLLTIRNALKNFNLKNFMYANPSAKNVITYSNSSVLSFLKVEVSDLLFCIKQNSETNNRKATNLIHSYNSFNVANTLTAVLVVLFSINFLLFPRGKNDANIVNTVKIEHLDSLANSLINQIKENRSAAQHLEILDRQSRKTGGDSSDKIHQTSKQIKTTAE